LIYRFMKLRFLFLFLVIINSPLSASLYESCDFSELSSRSTRPLNPKTLEAALRDFQEICLNKSYILPESYTLKNPDMFLKLESCTPSYDGKHILSNMVRRDTYLSVIMPVMQEKLCIRQKVGEILLMEFPQQESKKFSLHFITVFDDYQSKGLGGTALDLTILLTQFLSQQSSFYDRLSLQCADYDGDTYLGNVPYRLSYYLNHGFLIDPETVFYMRHLDPSYFIRSIDADNFDSFLSSYSDGSYETVSFPLNSFRSTGPAILSILKLRYPLQTNGLDERCLQMAEDSSSDAAKRILDRLFYDPGLSDEFYEGQIEGKIYMMDLEVKNWEYNLFARQNYKAKRESSFKVYSYDHDELNFLLREIAEIHEVISQTIEQTREKVRSKTRTLSLSMKSSKKHKTKRAPILPVSARHDFPSDRQTQQDF